MPPPASSPAASEAELRKAGRILDAEQRDGCRDQVVIGGLEGFVRGFTTRVRQSGGDPAAIATVERVAGLLAGYTGLPAHERAARLAAAAAVLAAAAAPAQARAERGQVATVPPRRAPDGRHERTLDRAPPERLRPLGADEPGAGGPAGPSPGRQPDRLSGSRDSEHQPIGSSTIQPRPAPPGVTLDTPIGGLKGIGPKKARLYERLELQTVRDLLFHFPLRHLAYPPPRPIADLFFQAEGSVVGVVERVEVEDLPRGLRRLRAHVRDRSGAVTAVWLRHGFAALGVAPGQAIALSGRLLQAGRQLTLENPDFEPADGPPVHTRGLVPVYPLTAGLFDKELRARIHWAVTHFADDAADPVPDSVRRAHGLLATGDALRAIHFPADAEAFQRARQRFAFEELLTVQILVLQRRQAWQDGSAPRLTRHGAALDALLSGLPFQLTAAQRRVSEEILADTAEGRPMSRLLQGEVGSGKTAVAALALVNAVANGYQGAIMAPTEVLAEQHFATLRRLLDAAGTRLELALGRQPVLRLLTGSVNGRARRAIYEGTAGGQVDLLVGTQALIQEGLTFGKLGLLIVDEQHRFGVKQRDALRRRVEDATTLRPHLLVMTATPIPRTLALSYYGDLDLSRIDELPTGRQPVKTVLLGADDRALAYEKVRRTVALGRQAFIICPLVEESEVLEAKAATEEYERLRTGDLAGLRLALLHGRMKPAEKDRVMRSFRDHEVDVLVSTAVVEVGVDVPNATVMLIEGAERFGLAQLHQFRGRVGRGAHPSTCILLSDVPDPAMVERLRLVERSSDGLELAEHDLRLRGEGDFFGIRQSGMPSLRVARFDDARLLEQARASAALVLETDPGLAAPELAALRGHVRAFTERAGDPS